MARPRKQARDSEGVPGNPGEITGEFRLGPRETPAERTARLRAMEAEAAHERAKDWAFLVALLVVTAVALAAAVISLARSADASVRSWATATITAIVSGYFAYHAGRQRSK